ncbi:MAG TPA: ankyrin repeat domain-containing protein [Sphingomicrobium sp.]
MNKLRFILAAVALAAFTATAGAQSLPASSQSYEFLKAVRDRDGNKVTDLLGSGNFINMKSADGDTALNIVLGRQDVDWTAFFLSKGADPNLPGKGGDTPLIVAARVGFADAVDTLLKAGAHVDATNRMGETALIVAVQQRQVPIVRSLLNAGADPDKTDNAAGYSARDYAARDNRSRQLLQMIEAKKPRASAAR